MIAQSSSTSCVSSTESSLAPSSTRARPSSMRKELVEVRMRLAPDVLARRQSHDRQLRVLSGEEHRPKRFVLQRRLLDVRYPAEHPLLLPCECRP
jgi:hypothetical protein